MRIRRLMLALAVVALIHCGCQKTETATAIEEPRQERVVTQDGMQLPASALEQGHVRVKLSEEMTLLAENDPAAFRELFSELGAISVERTFPDAGKFEKRSRKAGLHRWYDVYFDERKPLTKAGEELSLIDNLGYVEYRPRMVRFDSQDVSWRSKGPSLTSSGDASLQSLNRDIFNDPYLGWQWHYYNDGTMQGSKFGCDVNVLPMWNEGIVGKPEVIVAVMDGGIDYNHEDIAANMWHNPEVSGDSVYGYNFTYHTYTIQPDEHGTHVAGTIAAVNNNGIGVSGIAGGNFAAGLPGVKLMSCQIFIPSGIRAANAAEAIKWGADHGAVLSQNSWGFTTGKAPQSDLDAIDYFNRYAGVDENGNQTGPMKGGVVLFAAGNEHYRASSPADYEGCVAVAAVNASFQATVYTNYGPWVDLSAPGGESESGPLILSTVSGNDYAFFEGTSMACPHVTGVAALIVSEMGGPGFTRDMLLDRLLNNTTDITKYGVTQIPGIVNAYAAFDGSSKVAPDPVTEFKLSAESNTIKFRLRIPEDPDEGTPYGITVWYTDRPFESAADVKFLSYEVEDLEAGDWFEGSIPNLAFEKEYSLQFDAYDLTGNHSDPSVIGNVVTGRNSAPVIESETSLKDVIVRSFETKLLDITYYDPDGHDVFPSFEDNSKGAASIAYTGEGKCRVKLDGSAVRPGRYEFKLTVKDNYGAAASIVVPYTVKLNTPPVKLKDIGNIVVNILKEKPVLNLADYFYDEDGEKLTVKCSVSDRSVVTVSATATNTLSIIPLTIGTADVTVVASDATGATVTSSFKILVRNNSVPFDIYPNPVTDGKLFVRSGEDASADILVSGPSGAVVYSGRQDIGPFTPAQIDMSGLSSGVYDVKVTSASASVTTSIVNIRNE